MKPKDKIEQTIEKKLRFTAGGMLRDRFLGDILRAREESRPPEPAPHPAGLVRAIMRSPIVRPVSIAAVIAGGVLAITFWGMLSSSAYAIDQTYKALQSIRFLHIVQRDETGQTTDERWIEIGNNGYQVRYRQDNPASPDFGVIEDGEATAVYDHRKKGIIIYSREDKQYQWVGPLRDVFEDLRQEGKVLELNTDYRGRTVHKVWWPALAAECYINPETKLPIASGHTEFSYEEPPAGTFEIAIPEGYAVLDKRPGAPAGPVPDWLVEEAEADERESEYFDRGAFALARGDYAEAVEQLEQAPGHDSWAPFWLASAYYGLGKYELAIQNYDKFYKELGENATETAPYCKYARGLAYARSGDLQAAEKDFQACLPAMIKTLRTPSGAAMFEYAENPLIRYGQYQPGEREVLIRMINRLHLITGQDFGYDPNATDTENEPAISAWAQWFESSGQVRFTPDAKRLPVPAEWVDAKGFGRRSNQEIAARYSKGWLYQITAPSTLLKIGFALYDAGRYDEALTVFEKMQRASYGNQHVEAIALVWQGHVLDLLSRRSEAVATYRRVADMGLTSSIHLAQYGLDISLSSYAREKMSTPFTRVENLNDD